MEKKYFINIIFLLIFLGNALFAQIKAQGVFPKFSNYKMPSPAPNAPGDSFTPEMDGSPSNDAPVGAEWTRTAGPDESLVITGINFSSYSGEDEGKDTRFSVYGSNGITKDAQIQRLDGDKAIITLDKDLQDWSMYLIWPGNENGYGPAIAVNQTDAWWVGPEKTTRGASISVYGRNLSQHNDTIRSNVYIKTPNGAGQWAEVQNVNPYKVEFIIPPNLTTGEYEVWTHNGHGGEYGWSGPLSLTVEEPLVWTNIVFNVKEFGAKGDGKTDDTDAIHQALAAADKSHGSTIYFPKGEYMITNMLRPSSHTRWQGESKDLTIIKCKSNFSEQAEAMIYGSITNFQIDNMSFDTNNNYKGVHAEPIFLRGSSNLKLNNIFFSFANNNVLQLDNTSNVFITNCEIVGKISFLGTSSQLFIDHCDFYLTNDTELALHSWGGVGVSLTNSTCQDFDNSNGEGWGKGRFYVAAGHFGSGKHTYIANNRTKDLAVRESNDVDQNSGEQFLWEGFTTIWSGSIVNSSPSATILNGFSESLEKRKYAVITKGRGLGQSREIISATGSSVIIGTSWNVEPDETSTIAVGHFADRIVMYNNYIDGKASNVASSNPNASSGIQPYGGILNFIADNNIINEVRSGIANWATQHEEGVDPNYFSLFINNEISNSRWGIQNGIDMNNPERITILGTTYRNNKVSNTVESGIVNTIIAGTSKVFDSFIYEHNKFDKVKNGFSTGGDAGLPNGFSSNGHNLVNQMFYNNIFITEVNSFNYGVKITPSTILRENSYEGFEIPYLENSPVVIVEAPLHSIEIVGNTRGDGVAFNFILWNSGTKAMNWVATTDVSWLDILVERGSITNEMESQTVEMVANPARLQQGSHKANITITAEDQIKKYTILFKVTHPTATKATGKTFNLNTGSKADVSFSGETYYGDANFDSYFNTSNTYTNVSASKEVLYQTERNGKHLNYSIPLPNGTYNINTHHNELWFGWAGPPATAGKRVFDISLEGNLVKDDFDIFMESLNQPITQTFEGIEVTDEILNIEMIASVNNVSISGISITNTDTTGIPNSPPLRTFSEADRPYNNLIYKEKTEEDISIYPNPVKSETTVFIKSNINLNGFLIQNINGQLIQKFKSLNIEKDANFSISLTGIEKGIYVVSSLTSQGINSRTLLIIN